MSVAAVIVAAGRGSRLGHGPPKQFRPLGGQPLLLWSCRAFRRHPAVEATVVVVPPAIAADPPAWLSAEVDRIVVGGQTRRESVSRGLEAVPGRATRILVHDGARPFASRELIDRVLAETDGAVIPVLPVTDTVKEVDTSGRVSRTVDRARLGLAQTPQAFHASLIREAHRWAASENIPAPDDAFLCEWIGEEVRVVDGDSRNLKITTRADLDLAEWLVATGRVAPPGDAEEPEARGTDGGV